MRSPAPSGAARQFASTPRFVLPGSTPSRLSRDEIDSSDHEEPSSPVTRPVRGETGSDIISSSYQKDVIEDSEEEESNILESNIRYVPSDSYERGSGERDIVTEFDELFPPTPDRIKRRRVSVDPEIISARQTQSRIESILSSPESPSPSEDCDASLPNIPSKRKPQFATPAPRRSVSATTETPRPGSAGIARTPFKVPPRSTFSASQSVSRPSPHIRFGSSTPAPQSPPQRKKPAFVLPRSPSPSHQDEDPSVPTPFSPSSRSLRRGRPRSNTPGYLSGGMAAQVRSWILETAATREHNQWTKEARKQSSMQNHTSSEHGKYLLAAHVDNSSQGMLSSGPFTLVKGHSIETELLESSWSSSSGDRNLLLLGPPRSRSTAINTSSTSGQISKLNKTNVIGVHHGLAWEIELGSEGMTTDIGEYERHAGDEISPFSGRRSGSAVEQNRQKWLVGLEWDLIR